jgi:hypothetical protein
MEAKEILEQSAENSKVFEEIIKERRRFLMSSFTMQD